jgi:hypothetical protein
VTLTTFQQHDGGIPHLGWRNPYGRVHRALFGKDCGGGNCLGARSCTRATTQKRTLRCWTGLRSDGNRAAAGDVKRRQRAPGSMRVRVRVAVLPAARAPPVRGAFERGRRTTVTIQGARHFSATSLHRPPRSQSCTSYTHRAATQRVFSRRLGSIRIVFHNTCRPRPIEKSRTTTRSSFFSTRTLGYPMCCYVRYGFKTRRLAAVVCGSTSSVGIGRPLSC